MGDLWEYTHFGSTTNSDGTGDADSDGALDRDEWIAGTDPNDSNSVFAIRYFGLVDYTFIINWLSALDRTYRVYRSTDRETWTLHATRAGTGAVIEEPLDASLADPSGTLFIRITVSP